MAGLLDTIVRRLFGDKSSKKTMRRNSSVRVKPVEMSCVNESMDNLTMWNTTDLDEDLDETMTNDVIILDGDYSEEEDFSTFAGNNTEVAKDDYLLSQIDEFRMKAQQLQDLLLSKESKVAELQTIVDEREGKARELEDILTERQKQADGVTEAMTKQIDSLIEQVSAKMEEIGSNITSSVNGSMEASVSVIGREISEVSKGLDEVGKGLEDGRQLSERQIAEFIGMKDLMGTLPQDLEAIKTELLDKLHTENVKCYRNISDLFKGIEDKMDKVNGLELRIDSVQKYTLAAIVLGAVNLVGIIVVVLAELGVF